MVQSPWNILSARSFCLDPAKFPSRHWLLTAKSGLEYFYFLIGLTEGVQLFTCESQGGYVVVC